jgi:hypothetical protein
MFSLEGQRYIKNIYINDDQYQLTLNNYIHWESKLLFGGNFQSFRSFFRDELIKAIHCKKKKEKDLRSNPQRALKMPNFFPIAGGKGKWE